MIRFFKNWWPAFLFSFFVFSHAIFLPTFEGMDEFAHFSSVLHFATGQGRPIAPGARLHKSVEEVMALVPIPEKQLSPNLKKSLGAVGYIDWTRLSEDEKRGRLAKFKTLTIDGWRPSERQNWQAQHPPLYYWTVGKFLSIFSINSLSHFHLAARLLSALIFSMTGFLIHLFLVRRWNYSMHSTVFISLLPMWLTMGARIANDALAIPAFTAALLLMIEEFRKSHWNWSAPKWLLIGVCASIGLGSKAYLILLAPALLIMALKSTFQKALHWKVILPAMALVAMFLPWAWFLKENLVRTGSISGSLDYLEAKQKGYVGVLSLIPVAYKLVTEESATFLKLILKGIAQFEFSSNWTTGAAFPIFYLVQSFVFGALVLGILRNPKLRSAPEFSMAALLFLIFAAGIFLGALNMYIAQGFAHIVCGWYAWAAGGAYVATLALSFEKLSPRLRRGVLSAQGFCFVVAMLSNLAFWSGRFERHPTLRYPVKVVK